MEDEALAKAQRVTDKPLVAPDSEFQWFPNPTLTMYVFPHITPAGQPVPGYIIGLISIGDHAICEI